MKRIWLIFAWLGVLLLCGMPVLAQDGFYVIGVGGRVGTKITSVPYTIKSPGLYYLDRNLTYSSTTNNAITVNASDVTLDLMGFSLTGPGKTSGSSTGISVSYGANNVEIRNGCVNSFGNYGILVADCNGTRLIGLRIKNNGLTGAFMNGYNSLVMGCDLANNGEFGASVSHGLIKGNQAYENSGRGLFAGSGVTLSGNVCRANGGTGIYGYSGSSLLDNTAMNNNGYGIYAYDGSTVMRNTSRENNGVGIRTSDNCVITNNATQGLINGVNCTTANNCVY